LTGRKAVAGWFVYIVRCADGTLYTGITTDLARRLHEHNHDDGRAARYTRSRRPVVLVAWEAAADRAAAARREAAIKRLRRAAKGRLVSASVDSPSSDAVPPEVPG